MTLRLRAAAAVLGQLHAELAHAELVDRLVAKVPRAVLDPDLALLAYAAPDRHPYKLVATHLNYVTGGKAHSVALSGQGLGAPFTALRVAAAYERTGHSSRSLVVIVESAAGTQVDSGVLLAFGTDDGLWAVEDVAAFEARAELAERLGRLARDADGVLLVLGPAVADDLGASAGRHAEVHRAEDGGYCISVWLALAGNWDDWSRSRPVVALCESDPVTGTSHLAVLRRHPSDADTRGLGAVGAERRRGRPDPA
jgi:hypothetical protein